MSIFEAINSLAKLAESEDLSRTAEAIGRGAFELPSKLDQIIVLLTSMDGRLVEISLGLDSLADPIRRPPFGARDVEAMLTNTWPLMQDQPDGETGTVR